MDRGVNPFHAFYRIAGKKEKRNNAVEHSPDGISALTEIERRRKFTLFDAEFKYIFYNIDGFIRCFVRF